MSLNQKLTQLWHVVLLFCLVNIGTTALAQKQQYWTPVAAEAISIPEKAIPTHEPVKFNSYELAYDQIEAHLTKAPREGTLEATYQPLEIALPMADGHFETFAVVAYDVLMPGAAAKFPQIRSYLGRSVANPNLTVRITTSPDWGLQAFIRRPDKGVEYIETAAQGQTRFYRVFNSTDFAPDEAAAVACGVDHEHELEMEAAYSRPTATPVEPAGVRGTARPVVLKIYRFACSTTGEFSIDHGGTTASVLAAMVNYTNQLNDIYEADVAIRLKIVDEIDKILFLDPATDPYTGTTVHDWSGQNPSAMLAFLGTADKYDIGHVFARFISGRAIGVAGGRTCTQFKGQACSAGRQGIYGPRFFKTFGHEIGHQWAAGHTWNNCPGSEDQFAANSACEPGSGSTIMSYSGACGSNNITSSDIDLYYTACSIAEIRRYVEQREGNTCGINETLPNNFPELSLPYQNGFSIPISTPFELTGVATDPDGDKLTYTWDQIDRGPQSELGSPQVTGLIGAPAFRSFPPNPSPTRVFPVLTNVVNNISSRTEVLPTVTRRFTFALVVRDNRTGGAGVVFDTVTFLSTTTAGPFLVTTPNTADQRWQPGGFETITWDVANTDKMPVNCSKVNIRLSTDGGFTYPVILAQGVPNIGRYCLTVPNNLSTTRARVRIDAVDNIFFDISNANFTIAAPTQAGFSLCAAELVSQVCAPAEYTVSVSTAGLQNFTTPINLRAANLPAGATATFSPNPVQPGSASTMTVRFAPTTPEGQVEVRIEGTAGAATSNVSTLLTVVQNNLSALALRSPADATSGISTDSPLALRWQVVPDADAYDVQVATNPSFDATSLRGASNDVRSDSVRINFALAKGTVYYWRVRGKNACGNGTWVGPFAFVTGSDVCSTYAATDLPKNISPNSAVTIESQITVPSGGAVTDVNVREVRGNHTFMTDLEVRLIPPSGGTGVVLFRNRCPSFSGNFNIGFDDAAPGTFGCPPPNTGALSRPLETLAALRGTVAAGTWTLRVIDSRISSGGQLTGFRLELCAAGAAGNPPVIVTNNILNIAANGNAQINTALLKAEDPNTSADKLVFTLMTLPQFGRLELNGQPLTLGGQFTQVDLNNGAVRFIDNGQNRGGQDNFRFSVTDDEGGLVTGTFQIRQPVNTRETLPTIDFGVSPNPAVDRLRLSFGEGLRSNTRVMLFDATGRQVRSWNIAAKTPVLDAEVQGLPAGAYMLTVANTEGFGSKMVIVQSK